MASAHPSDRIGALHDEILLKILSLLPDSRLAFQTSVLSTRWRHLPSHCPVIRLPFIHHGDETTKRYMRAVDCCLRALRAPTLHYLQIEIPHDPNAGTAADEWIRLAGERSLRELHLSSVSYPPTISRGTMTVVAKLPCSLFSSSFSISLTSLHVSDCSFATVPDSFQGFSLLRELTISNSGIDDQDLAPLLRYCPVLESLQLVYCGLEYLKLETASIVRLAYICVNKSGSEKAKLVVEAPNMRSLFIEGCLAFEDIVLKDSPLLTDAKLYGPLWKSVKHYSEISLLGSLSMVKRISVDDWIFQVDFARNPPPDNSVAIFKNLKILCCHVEWVTDSMLGVVQSVLEECPSLVELHVKIEGYYENNRVRMYYGQQSWLKTSSEITSNKLNFYDDLQQDGCGSSEKFEGIRNSSRQLKYAVVQGFMGSKNEAQLLQFLLRHATALEKLVVIGFASQLYDPVMLAELLSHLRQEFPHVQIMQKFEKL